MDRFPIRFIAENHIFYHSIYESSRFGENLRPEQWLNLLDLLRLWRLWEPSAPIIVSAFGCGVAGQTISWHTSCRNKVGLPNLLL